MMFALPGPVAIDLTAYKRPVWVEWVTEGAMAMVAADGRAYGVPGGLARYQGRALLDPIRWLVTGAGPGILSYPDLDV